MAKKAAPKKKEVASKVASKAAPKAAAKSAAKIPAKLATKAATLVPQVVYKLGVGDACPKFSLEATSGRTLTPQDFKGQMVVLYFYPKDSTPGCTLEGQDFKRLQKKFTNLDCVIVGVSKDSVRSHESFKEKCGFPFELISDADGALCKAFDVIQMKQLYGRKYEGIERSTFLINKKGKVAAEWRKVSVKGHADEVLEAAAREAKT